MKFILFLLKLPFFALFTSLKLAYNLIVFFCNVLDGGEDDEFDEGPDYTPIHYNYRTGEIDPDKRVEGLYDNDHLKY